MNTVIHRRFSGDQDFAAMREMLIEGYVLAQRPCNMFFYYLDNWRFANGDEPDSFFADRAVLWYDGDKVAAFCILENESLYNLQVHPRYESLVPDVLKYLTQERAVGKTAIYGHQRQLGKCLASAGFCHPKHISNEYEFDITMEIEPASLPTGYQIRTASQLDDLGSVYRAKGKVFSGPHMTEEAVALRMELKQSAPSYSNDGVFLVLRASDMSCVSFAAAWLDPMSGVVGFEPVGTVPEERKKGLCKALLTFAFKACRAKGFRKVSIRTGANPEAAANCLYRSLSPANIYHIMAYSYQG